MTFGKFKLLVNGGEKTHVDFKLTCNAFNKAAGDQAKAKAELIKDICAMANNGHVASYLIIGLGDDGRTVQSVTDVNLTEQNIHTLIRDSIHPRPNVRVQKVSWPNAPRPFGGATFVIVQVGPNAKHAFRFAQDRIDWTSKYYFRKNEVWLRNGSTSDLATPEQIVALVSKRRGRHQHDIDGSFENVRYDKLPRTDQLSVVAKETSIVFQELGATIHPFETNDADQSLGRFDFRVFIELHKKPFVFRCCFLHFLSKDNNELRLVRDRWGLEHGLFLFVLGTASRAAKFWNLKIDAQESWGRFALIEPATIWGLLGGSLPPGFANVPIALIMLSKIADTARLRESLAESLEGIKNDEPLYNHLDNSRKTLNDEIRKWLKRRNWKKGFDFRFDSDRAALFAQQLKTMLLLMGNRKPRALSLRARVC